MSSHSPPVFADELRSPFRYCPACRAEYAGQNPREFRCQDCGFRYFHNVAAAGGALLVHDGHLLLTRRAHAPAAGTLDLPGGFVDPGETLEAAVARELEEELGLRIEPQALRYLFSLPNRYPYADVTYATSDTFFRVDLATRPEVVARDDVSEALWLRFAEITPSSIGLASARAAVERFLGEQQVE